MSVADFNASLTDFLSSKEPEVLAIKGRWGTGKTYSWDAVISSYRDKKDANLKYAYASLFGADSLWEVKLTLLARLHASRRDGGWLQKIASNKKAINSTVHLIGLLSSGETLAKAASEWSPNLLETATVCLDDFERMDEKSISHEKLLGFISELKLEHKCKVVLIYNSDAVQGTSKFHEYREKVVDREIEYSPSYEDVVRIAGDLSGDIQNVAIECAKNLELDNVRVVRRALKVAAQFRERCTQPLGFELEKKLVSSAILFSWIEFGDGKTLIPTEVQNNLGENLSHIWAGYHLDNKPLEPWQKKLERFSFTSLDELDALVWSCIKTGFIESDRILREIDKLEQIDAKDRAISKYRAAWGLFHDSLENNEEQFVKELIEGFRSAAPYESPSSLSSVVSILKALDKNHLATEMIGVYVGCRDARDDTFDLSTYPFRSDITDKDILDAFSAAMNSGIETKDGDIDMLAAILKSGNRLTNLHQNLLSQYSVKQIVHILKTHHGQELDLIIGGMQKYRNHRHAPKIGELVMDALRCISAEGKYQELRTKNHLKD
ncbi:hypothetical protein F3K02_16975 [Hydrogenophaga sp. D2P1]|uniref:KAP NTPase domain-containing protein n=1 Tax=Hydrogenophaga aromaticivorans TaxID=2610898 RepID=A0A7Y8KYS0_9BURK|nr:hypothetical protein [Hydrogenophaga aromaticivorans]NWF46932.1 hypothetical protein [Hydrogenophaga aromaticivorans]